MMLQVRLLPRFLKDLKRHEPTLQEEVFEKIDLFKDSINHRALKVHKLKDPLDGRYSFSVNYRFRIVFRYLSKTEVVLLAIGDHSVYD